MPTAYPCPCTPRVGAFASALAFPLAVALAACGGSSTDAPSAPKTYVGVDGDYTVAGAFDDFRVPNARLAGHVTLKQTDPASPILTGTASVTLYFGAVAGPTYTRVFSAKRQGDGGVDLLLTSSAPSTGTWEFVGTVSGGKVSGTQYLDLYQAPGSGSFAAMGGNWSGTR